MKTSSLILISSLLLSPLAMAQVATVQDQPATGKALIGGDFNLVDQDGKTRSNEEFKNKKYMLVYFGYSQCPDMCPTALGAMTTALENIGETASQIQPLFISIDTTRDNATSLKEYSKRFHPSFLMLSGAEGEVERAMAGYKVHTSALKDGLMDHSSIIYLMDKKGDYVASFNHSVDPLVLAKDLKAHLGG